MTRSTHKPDDRYAVAWSLDDQEDPAVEVVEVIDLTNGTHETRPDARCPACQSVHIDTAITSDGDRYDRCLACDRLWEVDGDERRLVLGDRPRRRPRNVTLGPRRLR